MLSLCVRGGGKSKAQLRLLWQPRSRRGEGGQSREFWYEVCWADELERQECNGIKGAERNKAKKKKVQSITNQKADRKEIQEAKADKWQENVLTWELEIREKPENKKRTNNRL